jgi:hypothetical protein
VPVAVQAWKRLALAAAVMGAVFLMHGISAQTGCAGGAATTDASTITSPAHAEMPVGSSPMAPGPQQPLTAVMNSTSGHGQLCVSTPPRPTLAALFALLALLLPMVSRLDASGRSLAPLGHACERRRAPPWSGRSLLTRVGVSRT